MYNLVMAVFLAFISWLPFYEKTDMKHKAFLVRSWKENGYWIKFAKGEWSL